MDHGDRTIGPDQQRRQGLSNNVRTAEDDRVEAGQVAVYRAKQAQTALRRAGDHGREAAPQPPDIDGVKAVHILGRVDRPDDPMRIDLPRQRQLHQHSVDALIAVELLYFGEEARFRYVARQANVEGDEPSIGAAAAFGPHIYLARRVISYQDGGETRRGPHLAVQTGRSLGDAPAQCGSQRRAIDDGRPPPSDRLLRRSLRRATLLTHAVDSKS